RKPCLLGLRTFRDSCIVCSYPPGALAHFLTQHRYTQLKPLANEQNTPFSTTNKRYITCDFTQRLWLRGPLSSWAPGPGPVCVCVCVRSAEHTSELQSHINRVRHLLI